MLYSLCDLNKGVALLNEKMNRSYYPFINILLRCLILGSKFILLISIAVFFDPADVAIYGLIIATISYGVYAFGFDFYTFSSREFISTERSRWPTFIASQVTLHVLAYGAIIPLSLFIFYYGLIDREYLFYFYTLLFLEHIGQEAYRFMVAASQQVFASILLFFRSAFWIYVYIICCYIDPDIRSLEHLLVFWIFAAAFSLALAVLKMNSMSLLQFKSGIDWLWVSRGLKVAFPFLIGTLAARATLTLDKFFLKIHVGEEQLAAYVFFSGICYALISFLDAGVFSFSYPKMISFFSDGDNKAFKKSIIDMSYRVIFMSLFFFVVSSLLLGPLLDLIGKDVYMKNIYLYYYLVAVFIIYAVSHIPHYVLYAKRDDRGIIYSHIFCFFMFIFSVFVGVLFDFDNVIPISLLLSFASMFFYKIHRACSFNGLITKEIVC